MSVRRTDKRRLELHTLRRLAEWGGADRDRGPVVELELGYRAAAVLLGHTQG